MYSLTPHSEFEVDATLHLCIVERNIPTPVGKRLSLTHEGLGKDISDGTEPTSGMKAWSQDVVSCHPCFICNQPIALHRCLFDRDRSAVPELQVQMGAFI